MERPSTPFSTRLSGNAKENELRLRNIFQWKKKRPPLLVFGVLVLLCIGCGSLIACKVENTPQTPPKPDTIESATQPDAPQEDAANADTACYTDGWLSFDYPPAWEIKQTHDDLGLAWAEFADSEMPDFCVLRYGTQRADERADEKLTEVEWLAHYPEDYEDIVLQEHQEITLDGRSWDSWRCTYTLKNQPVTEWYVEQLGAPWTDINFTFRCPTEAWENNEQTFQTVLDSVHCKLRKDPAGDAAKIGYEDTWGSISLTLPQTYFAGDAEQWVTPISEQNSSTSGLHIGGIGTSYLEFWYEPDHVEYYPLESEEILNFPGPDGKAWHIFRRQKEKNFSEGCEYYTFRLADADGNVECVIGDAVFEAAESESGLEIIQSILESVQLTVK